MFDEKEPCKVRQEIIIAFAYINLCLYKPNKCKQNACTFGAFVLNIIINFYFTGNPAMRPMIFANVFGRLF